MSGDEDDELFEGNINDFVMKETEDGEVVFINVKGYVGWAGNPLLGTLSCVYIYIIIYIIHMYMYITRMSNIHKYVIYKYIFLLIRI